jgi:metallo-beta-lactamase class B
MTPLDLFFAAALAAAPTPTVADTAPIDCSRCAAWNTPVAPFRLFGDSYYVGVEGISAALIATPNGLILLDGDLPQSVPLIAANIKALGYRVDDLKWILVSHAHYDHVGGIAALARISGAKVAASPLAAQALREGKPQKDDPQGMPPDDVPFPAVKNVVEIPDGGKITLGGVTLNAHHTPGHTPGGTSWTWRSCEIGRCLDLVYADSLNPVSADGFRFTADGGARVAQFRRSIAAVRGLRCDLLVSVHPDNSRLFERQAARTATRNTLIDPGACRTYADAASARLDARVREESGLATPSPNPLH